MEVLGHQQGTARQQRGQHQARARPGQWHAQHVHILRSTRAAEVDGLADQAHAVEVLAVRVANALGKAGGARGHVQGEYVVFVHRLAPTLRHVGRQGAFVGHAQRQHPHGGPALAHHGQDGAAQLRVVDEDRRAQAFEHVQHGQRGQMLVEARKDGAVLIGREPGLVLFAGFGQPGEDDVALAHALRLHPGMQAQHAVLQAGVGKAPPAVDEGRLAAMQAVGQAGHVARGAQTTQHPAGQHAAQRWNCHGKSPLEWRKCSRWMPPRKLPNANAGKQM